MRHEITNISINDRRKANNEIVFSVPNSCIVYRQTSNPKFVSHIFIYFPNAKQQCIQNILNSGAYARGMDSEITA